MIFDIKPMTLNDWTIIHLPKIISKALPSRGMVMADITIDHNMMTLPLEPDGLGSHWFIIDNDYSEMNVISITLEVRNKWVKPHLPVDFEDMLVKEALEKYWDTLTAKAQWEWIRWIRDTSNSDTRLKRIETAESMLKNGKKRPCCFNQTRCTIQEVSKNGVLLV